VGAERTIIEIELALDLVVNGLRDANGAGLGERLEPGGDVDAVAKDVVTVDDDIAEIDTNPQLQAALGRGRVVYRTRGPLHLDGATQRVDDARKIRQHAVAGRADDPAAMRCDQRVDGRAELVQGLMRAGLILAHQPAETGHIGMQDGGEFSLRGGESPEGLGGLSSRVRIVDAFDLAADDAHYSPTWRFFEDRRSRGEDHAGSTPVICESVRRFGRMFVRNNPRIRRP